MDGVMSTWPWEGLGHVHRHCISSISLAVVLSTSGGIGTFPRSKSFANCVDAQYPTSWRREDVVTGALWARSNLLSVTRWISAFIAPASTMLTTAFPSICCTRLVVPVRGSPITRLIFLHPSCCSSFLMISFILAHFALLLRSETSSYLLLRCT